MKVSLLMMAVTQTVNERVTALRERIAIGKKKSDMNKRRFAAFIADSDYDAEQPRSKRPLLKGRIPETTA